MASSKSLIQMRKDAFAIFQAALKAVDPENLILNTINLKDKKLRIQKNIYDLNKIENIYIIGIGKASAKMAKALESVLGELITAGVVITKYGYSESLEIIEVIEAGHPLPDEAGLEGTKKIIEIAKKSQASDLIIFLISGGGSALFVQPCQGITLQDTINFTSLLLQCGANIHEINTLRKHISQVKGGRFALFVYPASLVSLILSDVIGDNPSSIASGPTTPDDTTFEDCLNIINRYKIGNKVTPAIINYLKGGLSGEIEETPKEGEPTFDKIQELIIGNNALALNSAKKKAHSLGYNSLILSSFICGEAREVACYHTAIAKEVLYSGNPISPPACIISGGETTVTIKGKGKGGRNQELALAAAIEISGWNDIVAFCAGTDGTDGPTDAAGAVSDNVTITRAKEKRLDAYKYLDNNDSYHFFQQINDLIITNPTCTNVMDLYLFLIIKAKK